MQREIKFRAKTLDGIWFHWKLTDSIDMGKLAIDKRTLGQYTGRKDKNGKEIYEADLIQHPQYPTPLRVEWDYDQWGLFDGVCNEASIDEECEKVGNIFEK